MRREIPAGQDYLVKVIHAGNELQAEDLLSQVREKSPSPGRLVSRGARHLPRCAAGAQPAPLPFEKAILARCCTCALAVRLSISERETVACESAPARETCARLRAELRQNSLFALKVPPARRCPMPRR